MKILLGKKLKLVVFGLLAVAVLGFFASQPSRTNYGASTGILVSENGSNAFEKSVIAKLTKKDTDKDGLKDWEEDLWGTDPKNPDTDGDGTNDGDEVNQNRNPKVAGPDDEFQKDAFIRQSSSNFSNENLTETEKFSREFFDEYLSLKQAGIEFDDEEAQSFLVESALSKANSEIKVDFYTVSDLNIIQDGGIGAIKKYGNEMGNIIVRHSIENENEAIILQRAIENNSQDEIKKLDPIIVAYKDALSDFLNVSVPQSAAGIHLELINSFSLMKSTIEGMRAVFSDPLAALNIIATYPDNAQMLLEAFQGSNEYFKSQNVSFNENETGYDLTHIVL